MKAKEKYPDIKIGKNFNEAMKVIKADSNLCKPNYLDSQRKSGTKRTILSIKQWKH